MECCHVGGVSVLLVQGVWIKDLKISVPAFHIIGIHLFILLGCIKQAWGLGFFLAERTQVCSSDYVVMFMWLWCGCFSCRKDLGLLERLCSDAVSFLIHERIQQHIELTCKGNFEVEFISLLENVSEMFTPSPTVPCVQGGEPIWLRGAPV